ncbi:MAG TPA: hypothetical protein DD811_12575 [Syntrophomonas sp.]|nr:hypothetical protein [Syntrophomonas sp.]
MIDFPYCAAVLTNDPNFNAVNYKPNFWLVNGRAFPDTLLPHPFYPAHNHDDYKVTNDGTYPGGHYNDSNDSQPNRLPLIKNKIVKRTKRLPISALD